MSKRKSVSVPKNMQSRYDEIATLIIAFCDEKANEEYKDTCCQLCATLCRKRPSPLLSGWAKTWASAIVHAIGMVNFSFDPNQEPHITVNEIASWFGVSKGTCVGRSKQIRDLMKMHYFDKNWTLPSKIKDNPFVWLIQIDDFIVDVRDCPREIQEAAYRQGLIPYIPE